MLMLEGPLPVDLPASVPELPDGRGHGVGAGAAGHAARHHHGPRHGYCGRRVSPAGLQIHPLNLLLAAPVHSIVIDHRPQGVETLTRNIVAYQS